MDYCIRPWRTQADIDNFHAASFALAKTYMFTADQLDTLSESELYARHRAELATIDFTAPQRELFIAETADGSFAGVVWVATREQGDPWDRVDQLPAWVYDLEVVPEHRRKGIGKALMLVAEQWARDNGHREIGLHTTTAQPGAEKLYRQLGYGDDGLVLSKRITPGQHPTPIAGINVRPWQPGDSEEVLAPLWRIRRATFEALTAHDGPERVAAWYPRFRPALPVEQPGYFTLIAEAPAQHTCVGGIVGRSTETALWVVDLGVAPEWRRRGVGRTLMAALAALPVLPPPGEIKMFLNASCAAAISLLRSMGYSATDFYMRKPL